MSFASTVLLSWRLLWQKRHFDKGVTNRFAPPTTSRTATKSSETALAREKQQTKTLLHKTSHMFTSAQGANKWNMVQDQTKQQAMQQTKQDR